MLPAFEKQCTKVVSKKISDNISRVHMPVYIYPVVRKIKTVSRLGSWLVHMAWIVGRFFRHPEEGRWTRCHPSAYEYDDKWPLVNFKKDSAKWILIILMCGKDNFTCTYGCNIEYSPLSVFRIIYISLK